MTKEAGRSSVRIDQFFAGPGARADQWRALVEVARAWAAGDGRRHQFDTALADIAVIEEFFAYPGPHLMAALREAAGEDDANATLPPPRPIAGAPAPRTLLT